MIHVYYLNGFTDEECQ